MRSALGSLPRVGHLRDRRRARSVPAAITADEAAAVLGRFGAVPAGGPVSLESGWRNDVVLVSVDDRDVVLKRYPQRWTSGAIDHEHSILGELEQLAFPAVRVLSTPQGVTRIAHDDRQYALFAFVRGRNMTDRYLGPSARRAAVDRAGALLGELHHALRRFQPTGAHHLGTDRQSPQWYHDAIDRLVDVAPPADAADQDRVARLVAAAPRMHARLDELEGGLARCGLPELVIHGDFGLHNLLQQPGGSLVVLDFELARRERRLVDVAAAAARLATRDRGRFIGAYRSVFPIPEAEWAQVDLVFEQYRLHGAVRSWDNFESYGGSARLAKALERLTPAASLPLVATP